jgi:hypothetical protein
MSIDLKKMTAKQVVAELGGLSDEELEAIYSDELEGKGRRTILNAVSAARDNLREEAEVAPVATDSPEPKKEKPMSNKEIIYRPARPGAARAAYVTTKEE